MRRESIKGYGSRPGVSGKDFNSGAGRAAETGGADNSGGKRVPFPGFTGKEFREEEGRWGSPIYFRPGSEEEAVQLLSRYGEGLKPLAGGTDLLVQYYDRLFEVQGWLDLSRLDGLRGIKLFKDRIEIGALVTHQQLEKSTLIKRWLPVLSRAAASVGSPQIRSRGTIGGNIATASPAGDLLGPLLVYEARFEIISGQGTGLIPAAEFFLGPKKSLLAAEQLIKKVVIPLPGEGHYGSWIKVGKRKALIISSISLALVLRLNGEGSITSFRACFGSAGPTPLLIKELEQYARGKKLAGLDLNILEEAAGRGIAPIDDLRGTAAYRRTAAGRMIVRAVQEIGSRAAGERGDGE